MKGLSKFHIWLLKKIYKIPYPDPPDSGTESFDNVPDEDLTWITDAAEAELEYDYFGLMILPPSTSNPLLAAREKLDALGQEYDHCNLSRYQFRGSRGNVARFEELSSLPPLYMVIDDTPRMTDWEHVHPEWVPWHSENPKQVDGMTDEKYSEIFCAFLDENIRLWAADIQATARRLPDSFVVLLDCLDISGGAIRFESLIELKK